VGWLIISFGVAAAVAALATPAVSRMALALGAIDQPSARKVNARANIPLLGGIAIALGFFIGLGAALWLAPESPDLGRRLEALLVGSMLVLGIGVLDDRWTVRPWPKLLVQLAAAAVAIAGGFQISHLTIPTPEPIFIIFPSWVAWITTMIWIVVVTNAFNLIDGLDGLCTGVSAIIAMTLTVIAFQGNHLPGVVIGVAMVGALLGFLPYNFPPARIFVGDTGALFIGYILSILALEGYQRITLITFLVPLLALAVPLLDTGLSVLRRLRKGAGVMQADKLHIHHRLLREHDGSHRPAVVSIYFLTACFCVIAVSFTRLEAAATIVFLIVVLLLTVRILRNLGFFDLEEASATTNPADAEGGPR
jgi:UDP-GlcNAc:undecaprenyl-phosphate GlcNAc-1-phosphate transferase